MTNSQNDEPVLTVDEAAALTGRHRILIHRWIKSGELAATKQAEWPHAYQIRQDALTEVNQRHASHGRRKKTVTLYLSDGNTLEVKGVRALVSKEHTE